MNLASMHIISESIIYIQLKFRSLRVTVSVNFLWFNFSSRSFWYMSGIYMGMVRYGTLTITRQERNFHYIQYIKNMKLKSIFSIEKKIYTYTHMY